MGTPNIPNITPDIDLDRDDMINLLLASIALEEIGLSHILNAEGETLQKVVSDDCATIEDLLEINKSVGRSLRSVIKKEMLLLFKLEDILDLVNIAEHDDEV